MADRKISDLTALTTPAAGDYLPIVDISEVSAANKNKRITIEELLRGAPDGTAAAPSIGFESDPNTGIYSPGADALGLVTGGTERLRITSAGLVGIGTSSPGNLVTVQSSASGTAPELKIQNPINSNSSQGAATGLSGGRLLFGATGAYANTGRIEYRYSSVDASFGRNGSLVVSTINIATNALADALTIDSSQRVGIGTTSPNELLEVAGNIHLSGADRSIFNRSNNALTFGTNNAERARIDSSGRLLVGTSTSVAAGSVTASTLQVSQGPGGVGATFYSTANTVGPGGVVVLGHGRATPTGLLSTNDVIGQIRFAGGDGTDLETQAATISVEVDGTPGADDMPGRLVFSTTADGASSPTERLRITSAGVLQVADANNISVGTTTGTKIGTATTQKLGFYNATPVVQPTAVADATDAASVITQLNALLSRMRDLGLIAT